MASYKITFNIRSTESLQGI